MATFVLIVTIMNFNGVGIATAEFNSYNNCQIAGNILVEQNSNYIVRFACVEK
jgi:hypothetical protein